MQKIEIHREARAQFPADTHHEEYQILMGENVENLQGLRVAVFRVVDHHHPQIMEAAFHQLQQELS